MLLHQTVPMHQEGFCFRVFLPKLVQTTACNNAHTLTLLKPLLFVDQYKETTKLCRRLPISDNSEGKSIPFRIPCQLLTVGCNMHAFGFQERPIEAICYL